MKKTYPIAIFIDSSELMVCFDCAKTIAPSIALAYNSFYNRDHGISEISFELESFSEFEILDYFFKMDHYDKVMSKQCDVLNT